MTSNLPSTGYIPPPGSVLSQSDNQPIIFSSDLVSQLQDLFARCDRNANGMVGPDELKAAFENLRIPANIDTLRSLVAKFDRNKKGSLYFTEFCNLFLALLSSHGVQTRGFFFS